jgi:hypothetical protein
MPVAIADDRSIAVLPTLVFIAGTPPAGHDSGVQDKAFDGPGHIRNLPGTISILASLRGIGVGEGGDRDYTPGGGAPDFRFTWLGTMPNCSRKHLVR